MSEALSGAVEFFVQGGVFMLLLLLLSVGAGTVILLRATALRGALIVPPEIEEAIEGLQPGDSLLAPCKVSHVWAHVGRSTGRILVGFTPAGQMESFFRQYMRGSVPPPKDPEIWRAHGMELLGPPLNVE